MELADLNQSNNNNLNNIDTDFHGASIVTTSGQEIPITEQMLQRSFNLLIDAWEKARLRKQNN